MTMRSELQQQQHHRRGLSLSSAIASDRDDDLVLFKDLQKSEGNRKLSIPEGVGMRTPKTPLRASGQPLYKVPTPLLHFESCGSDDILACDWDKNDYDWLMTPPGTPLTNGLPRAGSASLRSTSKTSRFSDSKMEILSKTEPPSKSVRGNLGLQQPLSANSAGSTTSTMALDSSSCSSSSSSSSRSLKSSSHALNSAAKPPTQSSIQMSRLTSSGANTSSKVSRSHASARTPPALVSNGVAHGTTSSVHSAIPSGRSAILRPSTPVKRSPSPSHLCNPPTTLVRCSSANRASSTMMSKGVTRSRASSPTMKAWSQDVLIGFSQDHLPNLRTTTHERPSSSSKSLSNRTDQRERLDTDVQNRRKSGSFLVTRGQATTALQNGGKGLHSNGRVDTSLDTSNGKVGEKATVAKKPTAHSNEGQESVVDSHVKKSTKTSSLRDVKSIISSVRGSSGLGRNLPKKSADLGSKHMSADKSAPYMFRSFMSGMAKSSPFSKKSGSNGAHSASSVSNSPMATSSCASSEHNMSIVMDPDGSELGDESVSEKGSRSSAASQLDIFNFGREKRISSWLRSPDYRDDDADIMQIFEQEGLESLSGPESPLVSDLEGTIECDNFSLEPM